jgi:hypothetical protein
MMKDKFDLKSLYQMEKIISQPHYPKNLSLDTILLICHTVQSCDFGKCDSCNRNCQIQSFRQRLEKLKPSFCPGNYKLCLRSQFIRCGKCRSKALDLSVKETDVVYPEKELSSQELLEQITVLEVHYQINNC